MRWIGFSEDDGRWSSWKRKYQAEQAAFIQHVE
jgi:hypothetical protein